MTPSKQGKNIFFFCSFILKRLLSTAFLNVSSVVFVKSTERLRPRNPRFPLNNMSSLTAQRHSQNDLPPPFAPPYSKIGSSPSSASFCLSEYRQEMFTSMGKDNSAL